MTAKMPNANRGYGISLQLTNIIGENLGWAPDPQFELLTGAAQPHSMTTAA